LRALRWTVAVLLGALVATVGDHLHVIYGVLFYPHAVLFQQALWVFPLFVVAAWAVLSGTETVRHALGGLCVPTDLAEAAFTAVAAELPSLVLGVLVVTWGLRVGRLPRWVFAFGLLAATCGVGCESALSAMGMFKYVDPDALGVPRWLPALYLHASLAGVRIRGLL